MEGLALVGTRLLEWHEAYPFVHGYPVGRVMFTAAVALLPLTTLWRADATLTGNVMRTMAIPSTASRHALAASREVLGAAHISTLSSMYNLAQILEERGMHDEATALYEEELAGCAATHGEASPVTIQSACHLVNVLQALGQTAKADEYASMYLEEKGAPPEPEGAPSE